MFAKRRPPIDHLEGLEPFRGCSRQELESIAGVSDVVDIEPGYVLMRERHHGSECFVICEGEAAVFVNGARVAELGRGSIVGEMSLIDGGPRSATVVAMTPMRVVLFARPAFSATLASYPSVAGSVLSALSTRLRSAQQVARATSRIPRAALRRSSAGTRRRRRAGRPSIRTMPR